MALDSGLGVFVPSAIGLLGGVGRSARPARSIGPIVAQVTISERHEDTLEITEHPVEQGAAIADHAFKRPATVVITAAWSNSPGGGQESGRALLNSVVQGQAGNLLAAAVKPISGSAAGNVAAQIGQGLAVNALSSSVNSGTGTGTSAVQDVYQQLLKLQASAVPVDVYTGKRRYSSMLIQSIVTETDKQTENSLVAVLTCRQVIIVQTQVVTVGAPADAQRQPQSTASVVEQGTKQTVRADPDANPTLADSIARSFPTRQGVVNANPL